MKTTLKLLFTTIFITSGCGVKVNSECEKYVQAHACGKSNLPQKSQQEINDSCMSISVVQREKVISCIEKSNYCELYNAYEIDDAIKVSLKCSKKAKL